MGKAAAGSTKAVANAIKAKDYDGTVRSARSNVETKMVSRLVPSIRYPDPHSLLLQAHTKSEPHLRKMMLLGPKAGGTIAEFSRQFQYEFVTLLRTRHNTQRVRANAVYNEFIQDKHHVHMNATRWVTLSGFIQTLGKAGTVRVDEDEKGLWITWVDNTPKTLAKQAALQKRDRAEMDGEERERRLLDDQIARAKANQAEEAESTGLQKVEGEKITLNLFPAVPSDPISVKKEETDETVNGNPKPAISFGSMNTTPSNPLKRPASTNIFKQAKSAKVEAEAPKRAFMSESERLMKEDQARKARSSQGYGGIGPRRGGR
ncbi:DNA/RNA-binding protein KIN17, partial [Tremellales sp. Uapishka_1]